jgi:hypothetical protein
LTRREFKPEEKKLFAGTPDEPFLLDLVREMYSCPKSEFLDLHPTARALASGHGIKNGKSPNRRGCFETTGGNSSPQRAYEYYLPLRKAAFMSLKMLHEVGVLTSVSQWTYAQRTVLANMLQKEKYGQILADAVNGTVPTPHQSAQRKNLPRFGLSKEKAKREVLELLKTIGEKRTKDAIRDPSHPEDYVTSESQFARQIIDPEVSALSEEDFLDKFKYEDPPLVQEIRRNGRTHLIINYGAM